MVLREALDKAIKPCILGCNIVEEWFSLRSTKQIPTLK